MKKMLAAPAVAGVLLLGTASVADAQEAPAQEERAAKEDSDKTGLFGLIGLTVLSAARCGGVRSGQVQRRGRQPDQFHGERGATPAVRM
jgi:uncharacterized low-complexity protein